MYTLSLIQRIEIRRQTNRDFHPRFVMESPTKLLLTLLILPLLLLVMTRKWSTVAVRDPITELYVNFFRNVI